jgi:uncharacterized protein (TIGR02118 family)
MSVKLMVIYPRPTDVEAFDKTYIEDHLPMAARKIPGKTKFLTTRVIGTPSGEAAPYYRIAELHFPSMEALQTAAASQGAQEAIAHALAISTGGSPVFLVAEEEKPVPF